MATAADDGVKNGDNTAHDINSLLSSEKRGFLVRNTGDEVKVDSLRGKKVGLYFSASWCGPCQRFTPNLVEVYTELSSKASNFEIIFVSGDRDDESFNKYFSKMPWLAIPFSDSDSRDRLNKFFKVEGIPHLVFLDEDGKLLSEEGLQIILEYGTEGYPFTPERIQELKEAEENAKRNLSLKTILVSQERDYVISNDGQKVKVDSLIGKKVGLYFSASWCGPCQRFTPNLVEVYTELSSKAANFEIIFVSRDRDDEAFNEYFSKMPWLAIPFSDSDSRDRLDKFFKVSGSGIPHLVFLDEDGKLLTEEGFQMIFEYGTEGYPFTPERIQELKEAEENAKRNQSLETILVSQERDYVISNDGQKVPVSELVGKTVGLYFWAPAYKPCLDFTEKLVGLYDSLRAKGESFEIVLVSLDDNAESFRQGFEGMPWFALPSEDKTCKKLIRHFELDALPTLVILGPDGRTLHSNAAEAIEEHGELAYPFTPEKFAELEEIEKAKQEAQTLESVLVSGSLDFVTGKDGIRIPVSDLVGKNILLYFSAHWCPPCRAFLPILIEAYHEIKSKDDAFEVVFISSDRDQSSFDNFFAGMPWLALPFDDIRKASLKRMFKVRGIPMLVAIGPSGRTVTTAARDLIMAHGAAAYPFTDEHMKEMKAENEEMAKRRPEQEDGGTERDTKEEPDSKEGWSCEGEVCKKA